MMGTIDTISKAAPRHPIGRLIGNVLLYVIGRYDRAVERHRSRQALRELDDRLLRDIGVSRDEALRESRRSFFD